ncbi:MAG: NTP/NDP exchange transporter [Planctomycetota bacterium]
MPSLIQRLFTVRTGEFAAALLAGAYFFCVLSSYYILKPIREQMGIAHGVDKLTWLYTGTFVAMLVAQPIYALLVARSARRRLISVAYRFFALNLLAFFALLQLAPDWHPFGVAASFYVWVSVYNLFIVSVFWSFMADIFSLEQGKRLFGFISVGGTLGAIFGAGLTKFLVEIVGTTRLLLISVVLLEIAVQLMHAIARSRGITAHEPVALEPAAPVARIEDRTHGGVFSGVGLVLKSRYLQGICFFMLGYALISTFFYYELSNIVAAAITSRDERTAFFANIDLLVNLIALTVQIFLTGHVVRRIGIGWTLLILPLLSIGLFVALGLDPVLQVVVVAQVAFRGVYFATAKPAREMLFTVVGREAKYKSKNLIDTFVHRGGDALGGWIWKGLFDGLHMGLHQLAFLGAGLAVVWAGVSRWLGKQEQRFERETPRSPTDESSSTAT